MKKVTNCLLFVAITLLVFSVEASNAELILDHIHRGWFRATGAHEQGNLNTYTGQTTFGLYNSFFVFDLAGAPTTFGATLRLFLRSYFGPDPSETFDVYDVSTPADSLDIDYPDGSPVGMAIFGDLGGGVAYATVTVVFEDQLTILEIPMSVAAVADINASLGGTFAIGIAVRGPFNSPPEGVNFTTGNEPSIHQLVLDTGPISVEPTSWSRIKAQYR